MTDTCRRCRATFAPEVDFGDSCPHCGTAAPVSDRVFAGIREMENAPDEIAIRARYSPAGDRIMGELCGAESIVIDAVLLHVLRGCGVTIHNDWTIPDDAPLNLLPNNESVEGLASEALSKYFSAEPFLVRAAAEIAATYSRIVFDTLIQVADAHHPPTIGANAAEVRNG